MGLVLKIAPKIKFPVGRPFEVTDQFNGKFRGTWFYRDISDGTLFGPYATEAVAAAEMTNTLKIEPFQDVNHQWWWGTATGVSGGPFRTLRDAEVSILAYLNSQEMA